MLVGCSLDQPEHKVSLVEGAWLDSPAVIAAETLLVDGGAAESYQSGLLQQVYTVFPWFLCFGFHIHGDAGRF